MTESSGQPGSEIRAGDKVRQRDTEEEGDVIEVLPFYGSFGDGPARVLFDVAVVKRKATKQKVVVRASDLVKVAGQE